MPGRLPCRQRLGLLLQQGVGGGGRGTGQLQTVTSAFRVSLTVREFLNIAILSSKLVEMATTNEQDRKKATGLQLALETRKSATVSTIRNIGEFTDKQTAASRPREAGGSPHPRGGRGPQHRRGGNRGVAGCWQLTNSVTAAVRIKGSAPREQPQRRDRRRLPYQPGSDRSC